MALLQSLCHSLLVGVWLLTFASLFLCLGAWVCASPGLRRLFVRLERQFRSLPAGGKLLAIRFLATFIVKGSTKTNNASPPIPLAGGLALEEGGLMRLSGGSEPPPRLSTNQYLAGFALVGVATNAASWPPSPSNAVPHTPWTRYGVAEDTFWLPATNWSFTLGTNAVEGLHVSSSGTLSFRHPKGSPRARELPDGSELDFLASLQTSLGIVPPQGRFWHAPTPSNSLLLTWQDVYLSRDTNAPVSFQSELFANGDFTFRYGLDASSPCTNFVIGAQHNGGGETYAFGDTNRLVHGLELRWRAFGLLDPDIDDHDADGLSTYDEVMLHGSDPRQPDSDLDGLTDGEEVAIGSNPLLRDTDGDGLIDGSDPDPLNATSLVDADGDGIPDAYEIWRFGSTNAVNALTADITNNGLPLSTEIAAGLDPRRAAAPLAFPADNLAGWQLCTPFAATFPAGTNLVYERTFRIDRDGGWQQYFISAASNAPAGWALEGMVLEWEDSEGASGTATNSSGDSLWLPVSTNGPATLTLRLRSTDAATRCAQPLHLLAWAPGVSLAGGIQASTNGVTCTVLNLKKRNTLVAAFDRANRPCLAPPSVAELAATANPFAGPDAGLAFTPTFGEDDAATGGTLTVRTPGCRDLPQPLPASALGDGMGFRDLPQPLTTSALGDGMDGGSSSALLLAISPVLIWGDGLHGSGGCSQRLGYDPANNEYGEVFEYPLDSGCLWRNWWRDPGGGYACTCEPRVSFGESSLDEWFQVEFTYPEQDLVDATVTLGETSIWSDDARHRTDTDGGCYEQGVEQLSSDECDDCYGCENGNCDGPEGPSTGSLAFRIPLGMPRQGQVSGFLWFRTDEPLLVTPGIFNLSVRSDAQLQVESNNVGQTISRINCPDERGRDLRIVPITDGVRIVVSNALCTVLEHTWEITNVGGSSSQIHLRKISRLDNTMSDHTYTCDNGKWTCFDNIAQASEAVTKTGDLNDPANDTLREERVIRNAGDLVLSHTIVESRRFGSGETAVLRETARFEKARGEDNWKSAHAAYWTDADNPRRNGRPKLARSDDRAWRYQTWDAHGRELLRLEQWDGSECPVEALDTETPLTLQTLPAGIVCTATVSDYTPHAGTGDSGHSDDFGHPRTVTRSLVRGGMQTVLSRTWHVHTHGSAGGLATITRQTLRACSATAGIDDPGNAVSTETVFHTDVTDIPLLLRGQPISSTGADGVTTAYAYVPGTYDPATRAFTAGGAATHLRTTVTTSTAAAPDGIPGQSTVSVAVRDAVHGTEVYSATHAILADATLSQPYDWQARTYDDKNRLRSTLHSDGSSTTNAWSCCRLLWWTRRDGARILRSAATGSDHLYHAMEDVWLDELTRNHPSYYALSRYIKVTQHFMDALGRETNTVIRTSNTEGEAVDPAFISHRPPRFEETVAYPDGTSDHSVRTDRRGFRTVSLRTSFPDREESVDQTFHPTNFATSILASTNVWYHNGGSATVRHWDGQWTRETQWTEYGADGCRLSFSALEASDRAGVLTNAVTVYDFLGRAAATVRPGAGGSLLTTSNAYAGASSRLLGTVTTGAPATEYLYDALGHRAGALRDGIADISETRYETVSNILWRVSSQWRTAGGVTNAPSIVREQLTGLSDTLRSHTVSVSPDGRTTVATESFDPATKTSTATTLADGATPSVVKTKYGAVVETLDRSARTLYYHDAFLTPGHHVRVYHPVSGAMLVRRYIWEIDDDTWDPLQTRTYYGTGDGTVVDEFATYDAWGRPLTQTNALGHATAAAYDVPGRALAAWGATYPVAHEYDTAGRRTSLYTYRGSETIASQSQIENLKSAMDLTRWRYDAATGLVTNKVYADNSPIAYTHTPDGKPLRTTWARGAWRETAYDERQLTKSIAYSDATPTVGFDYDAFGRVTAASNAVAAYAYENSLLGVATNDTALLGGETFTLARQVDHRHRLSALSVGGRLHAAYAHDAEGRLATVSNDVFAVAYAYTSDGRDAGYTVTLTNGVILSRAVVRDPYRRHLVSAVTNAVDGVPVATLDYAYDLLDRATRRIDGGTVTNSFGYNPRSEVTGASLGTNAYTYAYDGIGNRLAATNNAVATLYTSSPLNQYTNIVEGVAPSTPHYDPDGNMVSNGVWSYSWDAENRLVAAYSNATLVVSNAYDHASRRVLKVTPSATHTYLYDGWNLIAEVLSPASGVPSTNHFVWGRDLSGTLQGAGVSSHSASGATAGGVGGLLSVCLDGAWYFPLYDHNGNVTVFVDEEGSVVAEYLYDAFGLTISQSGPLANVFSFRFSTKYLDAETGLYYYGYRFFSPELGRWLNRDPIEERGGLNLYGFVGNDGVGRIDPLGLYEKVAFGASVGFSLSFNGIAPPQFSAMLTGSLTQSPCESLRFNADLGIRLMRGGPLGMARGSPDWAYEVFGSISGTIGKGNGEAVPFFFNGTQWGSALGDTYGSSLSVGQMLFYNSALSETPRMGLIRLQSGGAFFSYNNDQKRFPYGLGDGGDRGWTGGGSLGFSIGDGRFATMGFDDFTGRADQTIRYNPSRPNVQTPHSMSLNQAQWFFGVSGSAGSLYGISIDSTDDWNVQHWIHSTISPEAGYFAYPQDIQFRLRTTGFIQQRMEN